MTDIVSEVQELFKIKKQKYINQGITVDEELEEMLLIEAIRQHEFMTYTITIINQKNKAEVV